MSSIITQFRFKASSDISDKSFSELLRMIKSFLPASNTLPKMSYAAKVLINKSRLEVVKIDACVNNCCLWKHESTIV